MVRGRLCETARDAAEALAGLLSGWGVAPPLAAARGKFDQRIGSWEGSECAGNGAGQPRRMGPNSQWAAAKRTVSCTLLLSIVQTLYCTHASSGSIQPAAASPPPARFSARPPPPVMQHVCQALRRTSGVVARRAATTGGAGRTAATVSAAGRGYSGRSGGGSRPQKQQQQGYQQQRGPGRPQQGRGPSRFADGEPGAGRGRAHGPPPPPQQQQQQRRRPRTPEQQGRYSSNGSSSAAAAAAAVAAPQAPPAGLAAAVADQVSAFAATVPPRRQGVTDGQWDQADELAVREALEDAEKLERQYAKHSGGEAGCGTGCSGVALSDASRARHSTAGARGWLCFMCCDVHGAHEAAAHTNACCMPCGLAGL